MLFRRCLILLLTSLQLFMLQPLRAADSRTLQLDEHQIHLATWGDIQDTALPWAVLLSGPIDSWHSDTAWFASVAPLLGKHFRVIAIDRASMVTNRADSPVGYTHFAQDIADVFARYQIESSIVVAFASSNIALQLFLQHPQSIGKVDRALLIDPDVLTTFSTASYIEDAKPFKNNLDKYLDYIRAGKYTARVEQKNSTDKNHLKALDSNRKNTDWQYAQRLFDARLQINNQLNLFREIAIYNQDLQAVMATNWPAQVAVTIFDTDFELQYIESADSEASKKSLIRWKLDGKDYYQSLVGLNPDSRYIETKSRSHLYQFEHPEKILQSMISQSAPVNLVD